MSSNLGTQSPPVDFTAGTRPIGKYDLSGRVAEGIPDSVQRKGYFGGSMDEPATQSAGNDIERAQKACLESLERWNKKWQSTRNQAQKF
ncbi:hypothetical protein FRC04_009604 [Tulasnella sp. 424]|nr:hypothetical protein FRC04_009604 [Tulasnella sp. 424]KAG8975903.1 hypothetical protein FRC05_004834 [Tulasnella sp. 425]